MGRYLSILERMGFRVRLTRNGKNIVVTPKPLPPLARQISCYKPTIIEELRSIFREAKRRK